MKIASEEDLLTLDASTGKKTYRHFTPEDYRLFETETILMREEAQRTIDEINCHIGNRRIAFKCGENGAFPPTRDGCIHSLSMRERG